MNRTEWKELHRRLRSDLSNAVRTDRIDHGGTYWTVQYVPTGRDKGLYCRPSIIRDRATVTRLAIELDWAKFYRVESVRHRRNGQYWKPLARNSVRAAIACIDDCRTIRRNSSRFHDTTATVYN